MYKKISYLQTGDLDGAPQILRIGLAHGQTKPIPVHGATGCPEHGQVRTFKRHSVWYSPVDRLHHVAEDAAVLHQLVRALLRRGEVVLSHLVHQVMGNTASTGKIHYH